MLFCIIPPHIPGNLREVIWDVLESHQLEPTPLPDCASLHLTEDQVDGMRILLEDAPIPSFARAAGPYTVVLLETSRPDVAHALKDALTSTIQGTAMVERWQGGNRRTLPVSTRNYPNAFLREMIIVPTPDQESFVQSIFATAALAA